MSSSGSSSWDSTPSDEEYSDGGLAVLDINIRDWSSRTERTPSDIDTIYRYRERGRRVDYPFRWEIIVINLVAHPALRYTEVIVISGSEVADNLEMLEEIRGVETLSQVLVITRPGYRVDHWPGGQSTEIRIRETPESEWQIFPLQVGVYIVA